MSLFFDAAKAWDALTKISYRFDVARKQKLNKIQIAFPVEGFPHAAGMQYARDVDFGIRAPQYAGPLLIPAILNNKIDPSKIEKSRNWSRIRGRLASIISLQKALDGNFEIAIFEKESVKEYSKINAKYIIKNAISNVIYFVFLDESSGLFYCRSTFEQSTVDYFRNQKKLTVLYKEKIIDTTSQVIYIAAGYTP